MKKIHPQISKRKKSTQDLMSIESFGKYGLKTGKSELAFFCVQPTNVSVLSAENIDIRIHHLMMLLSLVPELELICIDSCECFDGNKQNVRRRLNSDQRFL